MNAVSSLLVRLTYKACSVRGQSFGVTSSTVWTPQAWGITISNANVIRCLIGLHLKSVIHLHFGHQTCTKEATDMELPVPMSRWHTTSTSETVISNSCLWHRTHELVLSIIGNLVHLSTRARLVELKTRCRHRYTLRRNTHELFHPFSIRLHPPWGPAQALHELLDAPAGNTLNNVGAD